MEVQMDHKDKDEASRTWRETDRFGFILGTGIKSSDGPSPVLVRHREVKWLSIISQWHDVSQRRSSKVKGQCQKGIPASLRAKCWPLLCGAMERMRHNQKLYQILDESPALQNWVDVIKRDTDRQFPFHEMFLSKDGHGQRELFRVLKAYTQFRPDEGYCQAQGPVAAVLLMNMPTEEAFWCLVQISELYLPGYYSPLLEGVLFDAAMLPWVLKRACPSAYRHLQRQGVEPLMFATDWLMCLYTRHLPFNTLLRVWDLFFCYGVRVLFQVAVVLVRRVLGRGEQRESCDGQMETLERLRGVKEYLLQEDADDFIQEVCSVSLSEKDLQRKTERELEKWKRERPKSTFDPCNRCHGYLMACEQVKEMGEMKEKKERERGNLSLPLFRSPSSLSPSLLRKKWKKSGSKTVDDQEGNYAEQRMFDDERQDIENHKRITDSTFSTDLSCRADDPCRKDNSKRPKAIGGKETSDTSSQPPCGSITPDHSGFPTPENLHRIASARPQTQTHKSIEESSKPSNCPQGSRKTEGPSSKESKDPSEVSRDGKTETDESSEEEKKRPQNRDLLEEQGLEKRYEEDEEIPIKYGQGEIQTQDVETEIQAKVEESEVEMVASGISEDRVTKLDTGGEETDKELKTTMVTMEKEAESGNSVEETKKQAVNNTIELVIRTIKMTSEKEKQKTETVPKETSTVTGKQDVTATKEERETIQLDIDQQDNPCNSADTDKVHVKTSKDDSGNEMEQDYNGEKSVVLEGPNGGKGRREILMEVLREDATDTEDSQRHTGEERDSMQVSSNSRLERGKVGEGKGDETEEGEEDEKGDEVQLEQGHTDRKDEDKRKEADMSSDDQVQWPQDSTFSLRTSQECLNLPFNTCQPQHLTDHESFSTKDCPTDDRSLEMDDESFHTLSSYEVQPRNRQVTGMTKTSTSDQEKRQNVADQLVMAVGGSVTEGYTEDKLLDTHGHERKSEEITQNSKGREAPVDHQTSPAQNVCSISRQPQPPIHPVESPHLETDNRGEASVTSTTVTVNELSPHEELTKLHQADTDESSDDNQLHPNGTPQSEVGRLTHSEASLQERETPQESEMAPSLKHTEVKKEDENSETSRVKLKPDPSGTSVSIGFSRIEEETAKKVQTFSVEKNEHSSLVTVETMTSVVSDKQQRIDSDPEESIQISNSAAGQTPKPDQGTGTGIGVVGAQPPTVGHVRLRRYSSSRCSNPRVLSEDIFKHPKEVNTAPKPHNTVEKDEASASPPMEAQPVSSSVNHSRKLSESEVITSSPRKTHTLSKSKTLNQADLGNNHKRMGLLQRLRGGAWSGAASKTTIPKILIQDFSENSGDTLSSKERKKQQRETERRAKEEEKQRKKREKEMEKEQGRERKKPQTRGKSFQLPSSPFSNKDNTLRRSDSQTLVRRNSTPLSESYF